MTGNGTWLKKALRANQIMTFESLPSDHSKASFFMRAKASRKMKMLCASSSSRRSTCHSRSMPGAGHTDDPRVPHRRAEPRQRGARRKIPSDDVCLGGCSKIYPAEIRKIFYLIC